MSKIYIGKSLVSGRGLFASVDILKGSVVFIMKGKIVFHLPKSKKEALSHPDMVGLTRTLYIDPIPPYKYINHSCNPNVGIKGRVTFVAMRNIKKGEELTFDYSTTENSEWEMNCHCGYSKCRKVIRGVKSIPEDSFQSYLPYVSRYFREIYIRYQHQKNNQ